MPDSESYDEEEPELNFGSARPGTPAAGKGECPRCGVRVSIRASGRLWNHGPGNHRRCSGSGAEPLAGTVELYA